MLPSNQEAGATEDGAAGAAEAQTNIDAQINEDGSVSLVSAGAEEKAADNPTASDDGNTLDARTQGILDLSLIHI